MSVTTRWSSCCGRTRYSIAIVPTPYRGASEAMTKLKVMTVVGTRPEIIRLSRVLAKLDQYCDHTLVHTGQNYDYELNGIFFIPIASIILAGFFFKGISAMGAKVSLLTGLIFYVTCTFILKVDIHFIHIWGIEFLLNLAVMFGVSRYFPQKKIALETTRDVVDMESWKYTKPFAIVLVIITLGIYIFLGNV